METMMRNHRTRGEGAVTERFRGQERPSVESGNGWFLWGERSGKSRMVNVRGKSVEWSNAGASGRLHGSREEWRV